jgi:hypothetical protein
MIDEVWDDLRSDTRHPTGLVRRRIALGAEISLFAAVDHPSGTPLLLAELDAAAIPADYVVQEAAGFSMGLHPAEEGLVQMELRLLEQNGEVVFRSFVDAVIESVGAAPNAKAAFAALALSIHTWQDFFRKHGVAGLSPAAQQGLFGEIWVLREIVAQTLSPADGVDAWVGPTGANQDFELAGYALEVKTSTSNPLRSIRINNLKQLDDTCLRTLQLVLVEAERHANGDQTLPWAVSTLRQLIRESAPHRLSRLNELLTDVGYLDRDEALYSSVAYAVRGIRSFVVSEPFPRLTESAVPAGVGNVEYSISLEALSPHEIDLDQLRAELGALNADPQ